MEVTNELEGVEEALRTLNNVAKDGVKSTQRALRSISILVHRDARQNAPRSPMQSQINRARKTRRKVKRKARSTTRPKPGGLENSIEREVTGDSAIIFVAANSAAGKYAERIHDEKHSSWDNRGLGTVIKGPQADDEFILRAIVDNEGRILDIIKAEHKKAGWYEL